MVALVAGGSFPGEKLAVPVAGFGDVWGTSASTSGHDSLASRGGMVRPPLGATLPTPSQTLFVFASY